MQLTMNLSEGQRLKAEGLAQVERGNAKFLERARKAARGFSRVNDSVTTDDLRKWACGLGLSPSHHNCWGAVFRGKGWIMVGYEPSKLPGNHGRCIRRWRWEGA